MKDEEVFNLSVQDRRLIKTLPLIRRIAARHLRGAYRDAVEGVVQRVALKLWKWKLRHPGRELSADDWQRLANTAAHNEVKNFYASRWRREISLSEVSEEEIMLLNKTRIPVPGDTPAEARSLLVQMWTAMRQLSLRQKYALLFRNADYIIDLIENEVCSLKEIAAACELTQEELREVIVNLPLSDERIRDLLETKLREQMTVKQVWAARNKAKQKLRKALKLSNDERVNTKKVE